ncbi:MAG: anti-sigma factor [Cyanobacteria bacterium J06621_8]
MTNNPHIYNLDEILAGYVLGDLDEAELVWLNEQLLVNPQLRTKITQLESTLSLMSYGLPEDLPTKDLRSQILAQAKPVPETPKYRWNWFITAVTALSTLWLGAHSLSLRQQIALQEGRVRQQQELISLMGQPNNLLIALKSERDLVAASGSLFIAPERDTAVLTLQNLQPLVGTQVYRLWAISQGKKTGCVNFIPDNQGAVTLTIPNDDALFNASSVLITIEPEANTQQPLGSEFLTGSVAGT